MAACPSCASTTARLESEIRTLTARTIDALSRAEAADHEIHSLRRQAQHTPASSVDSTGSWLTRKQSTNTAPRIAGELARERAAREEAEARARALGAEMEELSAKLFEEANGMVAEERRARVALEERVRVLEGRARERGGRLERIEGAVARLERVRRVLGDE